MTTVTLPRATVEQALEALEWSWGGEPMGTLERDAITALRAALAQQAEPVEPVAAERERIFAHIRSAMGYAEAGYDNVAWRLLAWLVGPNGPVEPAPKGSARTGG